VAARGIDVRGITHVINYDAPAASDDYVHRVGRTARAEAVGDAFIFVSPQEETDLRAIERAIGKPLPRVTLSDFDYSKRPTEKLEIPVGQRLAEHRARQSQGRRRPQGGGHAQGQRPQGGGRGPGGGGRGPGGGRRRGGGARGPG